MTADSVRGIGDPVVDLRSDAVTRPTVEMWEAMRSDPLVWTRDGDRTVGELERRIAELAGFPSALLVPTGTMANTLALLVSAAPGDVFVAHRDAHVLRAEGAAFRVLARLRAHSVEGIAGHPDEHHLEEVLGADVRPTLLWFENTHTYAGGTIARPETTRKLLSLARASGLSSHLDGARLWNAAVASDTDLSAFTHGFDTATLNLDKGLGCPSGAVLCGSSEAIRVAREKMVALGGVIAQQGLTAAAGLVAIQGYEELLRLDHSRARWLADGLRSANVDANVPETNIVFARVRDSTKALSSLARRGVLAFARDSHTVRFVTHRDIDESDLERVVAAAHLLASD